MSADRDKHASDFGVTEPTGRAGFDAFENAVRNHVEDSSTMHFSGTYRGHPAIINYNPETGLAVIQKQSGEFVSGWRLDPRQVAQPSSEWQTDMTARGARAHDVSAYLELIDDFVAGNQSAAEFKRAYLTAIKCDQRMIDNDVFYFLQTLFEDADAYVADPRLRTEPEDLDDEQLRECAIRARDGLRNLGFR